jgi:Protein of unknown function (DUF3309)
MTLGTAQKTPVARNVRGSPSLAQALIDRGNLLLSSHVGSLEQEPRSVYPMLGTILLIILIFLLLGALPTWPYSGGWGYYPSGGVGLLLIIVIILLVAGRI